MSISNPKQVLRYYQQNKVAERYIDQRFQEPLNRVEHRRQVDIINKIIRDQNSSRVLEFAPGPARITAELEVEGGTSIDSSRSMLHLAKKRMKEKGKAWKFIKGNILTLRINYKYDLIFCFRFLLHFKMEERKKIYRQAQRFLNQEGYLVFEVMNKNIVLPLRRLLGKKRYFMYDKLYTQEEFINEMEANGFKVIKLYPVLNHFWIQALFSRPLKFMGWNRKAEQFLFFFERFKSKQPYEWIALCQKK